MRHGPQEQACQSLTCLIFRYRLHCATVLGFYMLFVGLSYFHDFEALLRGPPLENNIVKSSAYQRIG